MSLGMPSPTKRDGTSNLWFRARVPADIRRASKEFQVVIHFPASGAERDRMVSATAKSQIKFSLGTQNRALAKARTGIAIAHLERLYSSIRSGPSPLTQKESVALSGEVYRLFVDRFQENPGTPDAWAAVKAFNRAALEGRLLTGPKLTDQLPYEVDLAAEVFGEDLTSGLNSLAESKSDAALEQRYGWLADWVLMGHGLNVDLQSRRILLQDVGRAVTDAAWRLKRNASGDYSADPNAERFPIFQRFEAHSVSKLFRHWISERKPSASTISTWNGYILSLEAHVHGKPVHQIGVGDIVAWKDKLVAQGLSHKTINDGYLAALHTIFAHGISNHLITQNPTAGIKSAGRKMPGTGMLGYSDTEVARLLEIAKSASAERRWMIWLAASSGARIGEIAQLHGGSIACENGIWLMFIRPSTDGGTLKNTSSERTIPIHPEIVKAGFLEFVRAKGTGPLFYGNRVQSKSRSAEPSDAVGRKHPSKGATNHLAAWIRGKGFNDKRKAPNHALRHWWKTTASRVGISDSLADAIQGHAPTSTAGAYRHFSVEDYAEAISKIVLPDNSNL